VTDCPPATAPAARIADTTIVNKREQLALVGGIAGGVLAGVIVAARTQKRRYPLALPLPLPHPVLQLPPVAPSSTLFPPAIVASESEPIEVRYVAQTRSGAVWFVAGIATCLFVLFTYALIQPRVVTVAVPQTVVANGAAPALHEPTAPRRIRPALVPRKSIPRHLSKPRPAAVRARSISAAPKRPSPASRTTVFDVPSTARAGGILSMSVPPGLVNASVTLIGSDGPAPPRTIAPGARVATLRVPVVARPQAYAIALSYQVGRGTETLVRSLTVLP
jgi:hypothetical protein